MECIVLIRMNNGSVLGLVDDSENGDLAVFKNLDDAVACMENHPLNRLPYQIVELNEL